LCVVESGIVRRLAEQRLRRLTPELMVTLSCDCKVLRHQRLRAFGIVGSIRKSRLKNEGSSGV
jgi:hypothetical protein